MRLLLLVALSVGCVTGADAVAEEPGPLEIGWYSRSVDCEGTQPTVELATIGDLYQVEVCDGGYCQPIGEDRVFRDGTTLTISCGVGSEVLVRWISLDAG
jgi:hypothetical protein